MPETLAKKFAVNVLTPDAFKSIPKGSGNLLSTFDLSTPKIDSTNVVCATQGNEVTGTTATIAFTTPNASPDVLKLAIGTADIDADDPTHVVPRIEAALKDYRELYWVGPMIGGGFLVCKIFNALSSGGLSLKTAHRGGGSMQITLTGYADLENPTRAPMEFYSIVKAPTGD